MTAAHVINLSGTLKAKGASDESMSSSMTKCLRSELAAWNENKNGDDGHRCWCDQLGYKIALR